MSAAVRSPYGRRFSFAQACDFLDWPASRLRRWVLLKKIAHVKTSRTARVRRAHGKTVPYTKTGRVEFYERDLLAVLDSLRVEAVAAAPLPSPRAMRRPVDDEAAALLGPDDHVFG